MRQVASRSVLLLAAILSQPLVTQASPFPVQFASFILHDRACENPCGYYGQLCCSASETCGTQSNGQAACLANIEQRDDNGQWEYYTTTFVQTDYVTVTSTGSSWITAPTPSTGQCSPSLGETECGSLCCSAAQTCGSPDQCVEAGNSPIETGPSPTPDPPLRPTATTGETAAPTPPPTNPFIPPVDPDTGDSDSDSPENSEGEDEGLSGGAIAGIVIGALAGSALLLFLCCCLCVGSCVDRARGLLGLKGGSRSSSYTGSSSRTPRRTWFGAGPARPKPKDKKKSGMFGMATIGLILGAMAIFLGLKKKHKGRSEKSGSSYTGSSYYTYSYSGSSSSSSSSSEPRRPNRGR